MGKLNILQHKSWHVYSAKNQERVRRDEAKAREEEEADRKRANIAVKAGGESFPFRRPLSPSFPPLYSI